MVCLYHRVTLGPASLLVTAERDDGYIVVRIVGAGCRATEQMVPSGASRRYDKCSRVKEEGGEELLWKYLRTAQTMQRS